MQTIVQLCYYVKHAFGISTEYNTHTNNSSYRTSNDGRNNSNLTKQPEPLEQPTPGKQRHTQPWQMHVVSVQLGILTKWNGMTTLSPPSTNHSYEPTQSTSAHQAIKG